ncbi:UNVERIFIED_CONTAM: RNA methyltransferase [Mumia flava]|uniref:tRNA (cytidine(34)-2'-O)-methyltransferase n=1 Tax=Mumia flava TaxID=1348852 RepID=UPI0005747C3C|nr:tRNA (cytidine(34)-2'-O)-methyltransferase [Mumia flava]
MFRILYYEPRIPPNTGNAIRLSAATGAQLHLVEPLGFDMSDTQLKRAGLDYHDLADVHVHADLEAAFKALDPVRVFAFTTRARTSYTEIAYEPGDVLMFGPEPTGLPDAVLADRRITEQLRIPMLPSRRSLNLANSTSIVVYEAWRQHGFTGGV